MDPFHFLSQYVDVSPIAEKKKDWVDQDSGSPDPQIRQTLLDSLQKSSLSDKTGEQMGRNSLEDILDPFVVPFPQPCRIKAEIEQIGYLHLCGGLSFFPFHPVPKIGSFV